jgi:hypothetical protein
MASSALACSSTLKMEAVCGSETFGFLRTTQHYNPEGRTIQVSVCVLFYYKGITQIRRFTKSTTRRRIFKDKEMEECESSCIELLP